MSKIGDKAKKAGVKLLDQNADGALTREDARIVTQKARETAQAFEARFPLWSLFVAFFVGVALATVVLKGF